MPTPLTDFNKRLAAHDWTHGYSDDPSVYRRGKAEDDALKAIARESDAHRELFNDWCKFIFGAGDEPVLPAVEVAA